MSNKRVTYAVYHAELHVPTTRGGLKELDRFADLVRTFGVKKKRVSLETWITTKGLHR